MEQQHLFNFYSEPQEDENSRRCIKCNLVKDLSCFATRDRGAYHRTECKSCANEARKLLEELKKNHSAPDQDYLCPICSGSYDDVSGKGGKNNSVWCLDHNHKTKQFRGWLCHKCNRGLGAFNDDIKFLKNAIRYLED